VKTKIIRIGNSQGIRIPKVLLELTGLEGEVELIAENGMLTVRSSVRPREGWAEAFAGMTRLGDDRLLDDVPPSLSTWDETEWEW